MNKNYYLYFFFFSFLVYGQKAALKVGSNPYSINASAALEIESTTKGFLPPRMTLEQRNNITPTDGLIIYCTDCAAGKKMQYYSTPNWENMYDTPLAEGYIKDRNYDSADGLHQFIYKPVEITIAGNTTTWLNFNLGANYANLNHPAKNFDYVPTSFTDSNAYGSLFQWGRAADGHELINWTSGTSGSLVNGTSTVVSTGDNANNGGKFITNTNINTNNDDWRNPQNNTLWQGVNGINNPCPIGYRLPTKVELDSAYSSINGIGGGFSSNLKIPAAGNIQKDGTFAGIGTYSYTWTSSVFTSTVYNIYLTNGNKYGNTLYPRGNGASVRCIKN